MGQTTWKSRKSSFQKGKCLEGGTNWNGWKLKVGVVGAIISHQDCNLRQGRNFPLLAALFKETEITNNLLSCWKMDLLASTGALHCVTTVTSTQVGLWTQSFLCHLDESRYISQSSFWEVCKDLVVIINPAWERQKRLKLDIDTWEWHHRLCGTENITYVGAHPRPLGPAKLALLMKLLLNV